MRVLDDDRNLLKERIVRHLQVLDVVGSEVARLVQLDRHWGQTVGLQGQETFARLGGV